MHPLLSAAVSSPGLLLDHATAYAELASVELEESISRHRGRFLLAAVMWLQLCLSFALLSVSFMFQVALSDTLPESRILWLWAPPVLPAAGALACWVWLRGHAPQASFQQLLGQVRQDLAWLQTQGASHG